MLALVLVFSAGVVAITAALLGCAYFLMRCACELVNLRVVLSFVSSDLKLRNDSTPAD
jgi:hypothetical protein